RPFTFGPGAGLGLSVCDEIIFGLCANVPSGDGPSCDTFGQSNGIHYTGPASRNFDNAIHAHIATSCGQEVFCGSFTGMAVGFEDIRETDPPLEDRKSTRLNSSHVKISYAVFCLKKKKIRSSIA